MATEWEILDALVTALKTVPGLKPYHAPTTKMETPACVPLLEPDLNPSWGRAGGVYTGELLVLVKYASGVDGPRLLYDYTGSEGERSIFRILMATHAPGGALGGVVESLRVSPGKRPQIYNLPNNDPLFGRALGLTIYPKGGAA